MSTTSTAAGWTKLEEPEEGFPDVQRVSPGPLVEEIQEMKQAAAILAEMDPDDDKAKVLRHAAERIRRRLWQGCDLPVELPPKGIVALPEVDITADAVRDWCKNDKVKYRRTKSGRYYVDVESALEHAGAR